MEEPHLVEVDGDVPVDGDLLLVLLLVLVTGVVVVVVKVVVQGMVLEQHLSFSSSSAAPLGRKVRYHRDFLLFAWAPGARCGRCV